ncbi:MAG: PLP-dependent transferase [Acidobacteriales bacterium]|nr:PLP-dependent transferase [Terriglobales bacterium]
MSSPESNDQSQPAYKSRLRELHPSTRAILAGYASKFSERSVKPPLFRTSTFEFSSAEEGRQFFQRAYHLPDDDGKEPGLIYSRLNNPNVEIWEDKMVAIENGAAFAAAFPSGMSAISTTLLALLPVGARILYTDPVYGGTYFFLKHFGERFGYSAYAVDTSDLSAVESALDNSAQPYDMVFLETPSNPSMTITDIQAIVELIRTRNGARTLIAVDNTFLGPVFQHPFLQGADLVFYSATKFLGGHSDLIAGIVLAGEGRGKDLIGAIRDFRTILGGTLAADTAWMLTRSLETCWLRMERQAEKATKVATALTQHPKVKRVLFPGLLSENDGPSYATYKKQCTGPGSMITFYLKDAGFEEASRFLDAVKICHLAVSLGGTESLIEHPRTMTHSDMSEDDLERCKITNSMIRLSVGLESSKDLVRDLFDALDQI